MSRGGDRFALDGKRVLITGGSRGIGRAIALACAEAGASVAVASRRAESVATVARELTEAGARALGVPCHVAHREELNALVDRVSDAWGGIDVLVNNAGTNPAMAAITETDELVWDRIMSVNLKAPFLLCRRVAPLMAAAGGGSIINVSSIAGTSPWPRLGAYSVSKAGLEALTKVLARELGGSGIRANAIAPGLIDTRFSAALMRSRETYAAAIARTPVGRHGVPDDIVGAALFLASDAARYVTGQVIVVDGGATV